MTLTACSDAPRIMSLMDRNSCSRDSMKSASPLLSYSLRGDTRAVRRASVARAPAAWLRDTRTRADVPAASTPGRRGPQTTRLLATWLALISVLLFLSLLTQYIL